MPLICVHVYGAFYVGWQSTIRASHLTCAITNTWGVEQSTKTESRMLADQHTHDSLYGVIWDYMFEVDVMPNSIQLLIFTILVSSPGHNNEEVGRAEVDIKNLENSRWKEVWTSIQGPLLGSQLGLRIYPDGCGGKSVVICSKVPRYLRLRIARASREGPFIIPRRKMLARHNVPACVSIILCGVISLVRFALVHVQTLFDKQDEDDYELLSSDYNRFRRTVSTYEKRAQATALIASDTKKSRLRTKLLLGSMKLKAHLGAERQAEITSITEKLREHQESLRQRIKVWKSVLRMALLTGSQKGKLWMIYVQVIDSTERVERTTRSTLELQEDWNNCTALNVTADEQSALRTFEAAKRMKRLKEQQHQQDRDVKLLQSREVVTSPTADFTTLADAFSEVDRYIDDGLGRCSDRSQASLDLKTIQRRIALYKSELQIAIHQENVTKISITRDKLNKEKQLYRTTSAIRDGILTDTDAGTRYLSDEETRILRGYTERIKHNMISRLQEYISTNRTLITSKFFRIITLSYTLCNITVISSLVILKYCRVDERLCLLNSRIRPLTAKPSRVRLFRGTVRTSNSCTRGLDDLFDSLSILNNSNLMTWGEFRSFVSSVLKPIFNWERKCDVNEAVASFVKPFLFNVVVAIPITNIPNNCNNNLQGTSGNYCSDVATLSSLLRCGSSTAVSNCRMMSQQSLKQKPQRHHCWISPSSIQLSQTHCVSREEFHSAARMLLSLGMRNIHQDRYSRATLLGKETDHHQFQINSTNKLNILKEDIFCITTKLSEATASGCGCQKLSFLQTEKELAIMRFAEKKATLSRDELLYRLSPKQRYRLATMRSKKSQIKNQLAVYSPKTTTTPSVDKTEAIRQAVLLFKYHKRHNTYSIREAVGYKALVSRNDEEITTPPTTPRKLNFSESLVVAEILRKERKVQMRPVEIDLIIVVIGVSTGVAVLEKRRIRRRHQQFNRYRHKTFYRRRVTSFSIPRHALRHTAILTPTPPCVPRPLSSSTYSPRVVRTPTPDCVVRNYKQFHSIFSKIIPTSIADPARKELEKKGAMLREEFFLGIH